MKLVLGVIFENKMLKKKKGQSSSLTIFTGQVEFKIW
jgi:hypothetical protein